VHGLINVSIGSTGRHAFIPLIGMSNEEAIAAAEDVPLSGIDDFHLTRRANIFAPMTQDLASPDDAAVELECEESGRT